jgi:hypothetical protein
MLAATGAALGSRVGFRLRPHEAEGLYAAEDLAEFQAALQREVARLADSLVPPAAGYVAFLLRFSEMACLAPARIHQVLEVAKRSCKSPRFANLLNAAAQRQNFRTGEAEAIRGSVCLVTLGLPCVPWKIPNRWGLRSEPDYSACFNPFALAAHKPQGVIEALASDFSRYCRPDDLMMVTSQRGERVPARRDRCALWTHNAGAHWASDNFAPLMANMTWKIANFRAACRRPNPVFLMSNVPAPHADKVAFLPNLQQALRRHTGRHDNHIVLTNQTAGAEGISLHRIDDTTIFFHCPYPKKGYFWNLDESVDSAEGVAYERRYVELIQESLAQFGLIERQGRGRVCADS